MINQQQKPSKKSLVLRSPESLWEFSKILIDEKEDEKKKVEKELNEKIRKE